MSSVEWGLKPLESLLTKMWVVLQNLNFLYSFLSPNMWKSMCQVYQKPLNLKGLFTHIIYDSTPVYIKTYLQIILAV